MVDILKKRSKLRSSIDKITLKKIKDSKSSLKEEIINKIKEILIEGGSGSGNFGHEGRPGFVGGSGEGGSSAKVRVKAGVSAQLLLKNAAKQEPKISSFIKGISSKNGGQLDNFQFRLKTKESIERKILSRVKENPGLSIETASSNLTDIVRYRICYSSGDFTKKVNSTVDDLKRSGYSIKKAKNFFGSTNPGYHGLNMKMQNPKNNFTFELQFHTPKSAKITNGNHILYEKFRVSKNPKERTKLMHKMNSNWKKFTIPSGAKDLFKG